jgi:3(or 17)beta-hydroxysteroid dehydrogenase
MSNRIANKVALISGAASGIGEATATLFANEGAKVVVADINDERGQQVVNNITQQNQQALFMHLDVTQEEEWERALSLTLTHFGKLDVLVNNAGILSFMPTSVTPLVVWHRVLSVNLDGVFLGTKHGIKAMQNNGGSIINISSIEGIIGTAMCAAYCASKGGVRLFTKAVAIECAQAKNNIRVNSVHPGPVKTTLYENNDMLKNIMAQLQTTDEEVWWQTLAKLVPIGQFAKPEQIAHGILFLASDESSYMTGSELILDGGWTAQ